MIRIFQIILFYIFAGQNAQSQKTWTLDDCISYALENNLTVEDSRLTESARQERYRQAYREFLPYVGAGTSYSIRYGRSVDPNTNVITSTDFYSNNYSINASVEIFRGFQRSNAVKASEFLLKAAHEDVRREQYLLSFRILSAYYDVMFYHEHLKITREQVSISQSQYDLVRRQIELGLKAGTDLHEVEAVLVADHLAMTRSANNLKAARLTLKQEMNLNDTVGFMIDTTEFSLHLANPALEPDPESVYRSTLAFLPDVRAAQVRIQAAEKNLAISRGNLYPSLGLSAGYGTGFYETRLNSAGEIIPFGVQFRDNASFYIGVSLNIPIVDRWRIRSGINQQKIAIRQSENQLKIQKQETEKLIRQLIQDNSAARAEFVQSRQSEAAGRLAYEVAQKKYDKGLISVIELNQTKALFSVAQNENLQIKLKLLVLEKTLDFYQGQWEFGIN